MFEWNCREGLIPGFQYLGPHPSPVTTTTTLTAKPVFIVSTYGSLNEHSLNTMIVL